MKNLREIARVDNDLDLNKLKSLLLSLRQSMLNYDFRSLYYKSCKTDSEVNIKFNVKERVNDFIVNINNLKFIIGSSDGLLKQLRNIGEYDSIIHALEFLSKLRYDLQNNHYVILTLKGSGNINNTCKIYFSGMICSDNPIKTKELWLDVIDDMLFDM